MLTINDIENAHNRIFSYVHQTPVHTSERLNKWLGHRVYFKLECFQKVGAFKARGACNTLAWLKEKNQLPDKIVTNSSGNHAQAVAWAASQFNIPATVFMPKNVSRVKAQATAAYGAEVIFCESRSAADEQVVKAAEESGTFWLPPFNHEQVIAGQGTAAFEAFKQLADMGVPQVDAVFAPCGGGGVLSGTLISSRGLSPETQVIGAEPMAANDAARSLRSGKICRLDTPPITLADGAMPMAVGELTFDYLRKLDGFVEVDETSIAYWTQWLTHLLKLHVEPTSAMSMAAVKKFLRKQESPQAVLVIITGGNIDQSMMKKLWTDDYLSDLPSLT